MFDAYLDIFERTTFTFHSNMSFPKMSSVGLSVRTIDLLGHPNRISKPAVRDGSQINVHSRAVLFPAANRRIKHGVTFIPYTVDDNDDVFDVAKRGTIVFVLNGTVSTATLS